MREARAGLRADFLPFCSRASEAPCSPLLPEPLTVFLLRHSLHAISSQLSPVPGCKGIELLEAETFDLHNFQTPTGIKFFAVAECRSQGVDRFLKR